MPISYVKSTWEKEANITLIDDDWQNICKINTYTTSYGQWRESALKNVISYFIMPRRTYLQNGRPESRRQCSNVMADHFHIFWHCPLIQSYWLEVTKEIN